MINPEPKKKHSFELLGIEVNPLSQEQILEQMAEWVSSRSQGNTVVVANTHVITESCRKSALGFAVRNASLVIPDGMPLVLAARRSGFPLKSRSDGPGLMLKALCEEPYKQWKHFLYGGTREVLSRLRSKFPDAKFVGSVSPPFKELAPGEIEKDIADINTSRADILWVGLGCPKQEVWMQEHRDALDVPVILGVGQAFDILAGAKKRAPRWMQEAGLEWLFRLMQEPKRLWKRYTINNIFFVMVLLLQRAGIIRFDPDGYLTIFGKRTVFGNRSIQ